MLTILFSGSGPAELHPLLCRLIERTGMMDPKLHTCGYSSHSAVPLYDVQTAALIIVTMKLLFGLNDQTEWWTYSFLTCHICFRYLFLIQMLLMPVCVCFQGFIQSNNWTPRCRWASIGCCGAADLLYIQENIWTHGADILIWCCVGL